jgi:integrase
MPSVRRPRTVPSRTELLMITRIPQHARCARGTGEPRWPPARSGSPGTSNAPTKAAARSTSSPDASPRCTSPGHPVHPEWYSDEFTRMLKRAGLPKIRLHDSRHTTLSLMDKAGVPISIISKWAGHYDSVLHDEDLRPRERRRPEARSPGAGQDSPHHLEAVRDCERTGPSQA